MEIRDALREERSCQVCTDYYLCVLLSISEVAAHIPPFHRQGLKSDGEPRLSGNLDKNCM